MPPRKRLASRGDGSSKEEPWDLEALPSISSGKKKRRGTKLEPEPEKRACRYISKPNARILERIERAYSHRLYLIDKVPVGDPASPSACEYVVLGNTGNVYKVKLQEIPTCSCPDFVRGHLCKHYLFVMLRVLKLSDTDPRVWQKALLPSELSDILRQSDAAGEVLASQSVIQRFQEITGKKNAGIVKVADEPCKGIQRPVDGDCPICYEPLATATKRKAEPVVFCRTCGNNVHSECFQKWSKTKGQGRVTCIYCRAVWVDDSKKKPSSSKDIGAEGYVNLAAYSDTHLNADETLETLYPSSYHWINRRGV